MKSLSLGILTVLLAVTGASAQTVTAAWDRNTDGVTAGYRLYYGTASGVYTANIDSGDTVQAPVTLAPGSTYYFIVRAYNAASELGPASSEMSVTMPPPITPVDCQMSAWTFSSATEWGACTSGQQSRTETWTRSILTPPSGGGAACGATSETRVATQPCGTAPTASLTAAAGTTAGTAAVSWQSAGATTVRLNGATVAASGSAVFTIAQTTTYTLAASNTYGTTTRTATVTPRIDCALGSWTFQSATTWGACTAGQRTRTETWTRAIITSPSGGGAACGATQEARVVSEPCVMPPVNCVQSDWAFASSTAWGACVGGQQSRTETWARSIITQPQYGGAACGASTEQRNTSQSCTSAPAAPASPVQFKAAMRGSQVSLSWQPATTGGAPTGYRLWVGTGGTWQFANGIGVGETMVTGNLPAGQYQALVTAFNAQGESAAAPRLDFRVGAKLRPGSPAGFTASLENNIAVLSWTAPAGDVEDAPTGYIVEAGSAAGLTNLGRLPVGPVNQFQTAVPPGTYFVRVRAINDVGMSAPSDERVLSTGAGPGAPANLTVGGTGTLVALAWQAPSAGVMPASYVIEAGSGPGLANLAVLRAGNVTSFTTTAPPGVYYVRVRAVGPDGVAGDASNEIVVRR
jgi:hypothetical protein